MSINLQYRPDAPLGYFVRVIWYYEGYTQPHTFERLMPDGSLGLVINLDEDRVRIYDRSDVTRFQLLSGSVVLGAQTEFFVIDTAQQRCVLGVQFRPGGAGAFLGLPADELQGAHLSIEDVWGSEARSLRERILEANGPEARCRVMETELMDKARGHLQLRPEIDFAVRELNRQASVSQVAARTGFTAKRFTDQFRAAVGLNPKAFSRVRRFQSVLRSIARCGDVDWTELALGCGYFDQAHFNHDFRAFSGLNPSTYLAKRTPHLNHVPM